MGQFTFSQSDYLWNKPRTKPTKRNYERVERMQQEAAAKSRTPTLQEVVAQKAAGIASNVVPQKSAQKFGRSLGDAVNYLTPVGNVMDAQTFGRDAQGAVGRGDALGAAANAGGAFLSMLPIPGAAKKAGGKFFRETNLDEMEYLIPDGGSMRSQTFGKPELFVSDVPELARGQGDNVGVLLEFLSDGLDASPHFSKPGLGMVADQGGGRELLLKARDAEITERLRAFTIKPEAVGNKFVKRRINGVVNHLVANKGWTKSVQPDGSIKLTFTEPSQPSVGGIFGQSRPRQGQ